MIRVHFADGTSEVFEDATRFANDEHNNLELYGGPSVRNQPPSELMEVFAEGYWVRVGVCVEDDDAD